MRKVTREVVTSFMAMTPIKKGNSHTDGTTLYLHDNAIAMHTTKGLKITLAGWNSNTTRERLNGLPGVSVNTKLGQAYLNGKPWGGEWVFLNEWN